MSSDNVNAAADDSFVFDPNANFGEEDYTEKPKEKKPVKNTNSMQQRSAWDPNFVNQQKNLQLQEAEKEKQKQEADRLALMSAPIDSIHGDKGSDTDMTNFESYYRKGGSKRKRTRSMKQKRSRKQKRSKKQSKNRRRSSKR
jgi:hypothetical protein